MLNAIHGEADSRARGLVSGGASSEYQHGAKRAEHAEWTRALDAAQGRMGSLTVTFSLYM